MKFGLFVFLVLDVLRFLHMRLDLNSGTLGNSTTSVRGGPNSIYELVGGATSKIRVNNSNGL
jgi:hypothetical protein